MTLVNASQANSSGFLEALAELEDHECHRTRKFPKTRLHRVVGYKEPIYRANIDKIYGLASAPAV